MGIRNSYDALKGHVMMNHRALLSVVLASLFIPGCRGGQELDPAASVPAQDRRSHLVLQDAEMSTTIAVRYIVNDVDAAIAFYTELLEFQVEQRPAPGFASLSRGNLRLLLNKPGAGGAGQAMPDGRKPES